MGNMTKMHTKGEHLMEIQLQELIDQIKKDGVSAAEAEAASIISAAKAEAEKMGLEIMHLRFIGGKK